jgi:hypothetical protein
LVPPLPRYYGRTKTPCRPSRLASFSFARWYCHSLLDWCSARAVTSALPRSQEPCPGARLTCMPRYLPAAVPVTEAPRPPTFPCNPRAFALLSDPGGTFPTGISSFRCCSRSEDGESFRIDGTFEAQSHGFCTRCLRFTRVVTAAHARLASVGVPGLHGRVLPRWAATKGFCSRFLLSRTLRGATPAYPPAKVPMVVWEGGAARGAREARSVTPNAGNRLR